MTARILIVDDVLANVKLLDVKLKTQGFSTFSALNGRDALTLAKREPCDLILLDVMMPQMDGFEVCRRLKAMPETASIPVIMVTALDREEDRAAGFEAGADDFITKPVNDLALLSRVKSLVGMRAASDAVDEHSAEHGGNKEPVIASDDDPTGGAMPSGTVLAIEPSELSAQKIAVALANPLDVTFARSAAEAFRGSNAVSYDLIVVSLTLPDADGLTVCQQLKAAPFTRKTPILAIADANDKTIIVKGMEIGVNDFITRPIEVHELRARARSLLKHKALADQLAGGAKRERNPAAEQGPSPLEQQYFQQRLEGLIGETREGAKILSLSIIELQDYNVIARRYGEEAAQTVLQSFGNKIALNVRGFDLVGKLGETDFGVAMPETDTNLAKQIIQRVASDLVRNPFIVNGKTIETMPAIGLASTRGTEDDANMMILKARKSLMRSREANKIRRGAA